MTFKNPFQNNKNVNFQPEPEKKTLAVQEKPTPIQSAIRTMPDGLAKLSKEPAKEHTPVKLKEIISFIRSSRKPRRFGTWPFGLIF